MPEIILTDPAILFAFGREARGFLRDFLPREQLRAAPCRTRFCGLAPTPVVVVETGVGQERMHKALDWVLGRPSIRDVPYVPTLVVSAGFSGALAENLGVGDVIVATEVIAADGTRLRVTWPEDRNRDGSLPFHYGRLLTVDRFITDPAEKRALALRHEALAVDMETAAVARRCLEHGVRFGCVRAISDDAHAPLSPELDHLIVNGRLSYRRLGASLVRRPRLVRELWKLAANTRVAADRLGKAVGHLLAESGPERAEKVTI